MEYVLRLSGGYVDAVWRVLGYCLEGVRRLSDSCGELLSGW